MPGAAPGWHAELELQFAHRAGRTYLAKRRHVGPLRVQRTFHPEGAVCHAYLVHPPGGVVGGDELQLQVDVGCKAHALLTTPAATKFYRTAGPIARQTHCLRVDGTLEWLPQETIFYSGARAHTATHLQLSADARVLAWEIACLGLPARQEDFTAGELALDFELWVQHRPLLIDRLRIHAQDEVRTACWGLGGHRAIGILVAYPGSTALLTALREVAAAGVAATLVDGVLVCRCVAQQAHEVRRAFVAAWQILRPALLDREALPPRIWAT
jgi:urease accessory protein